MFSPIPYLLSLPPLSAALFHNVAPSPLSACLYVPPLVEVGAPACLPHTHSVPLSSCEGEAGGGMQASRVVVVEWCVWCWRWWVEMVEYLLQAALLHPCLMPTPLPFYYLPTALTYLVGTGLMSLKYIFSFASQFICIGSVYLIITCVLESTSYFSHTHIMYCTYSREYRVILPKVY